jgi:hypothetical protein
MTSLRQAAVVGVAAILGTGVLAAPAFGAPSNAPSSLTFPFVVCYPTPSNPSQGILHTQFVVNSAGRGPGLVAVDQSTEAVFQPYALSIFVNGLLDPDSSFEKAPLVDKATYVCEGTAEVGDPNEPTVITFVAQGVFKG